MRIFQIVTAYPEYYKKFALNRSASDEVSYQVRLGQLLDDCFGGVHILRPNSNETHTFLVTFANDAILQRRWAFENSVSNLDLTEILLAQIEHHRTEVVYNMDPVRWDSSFVRRLPGCVKKTICWRASTDISDLSAYDLRVCNFPNILRRWEVKGLKSAYFSPSFDPHMARYGQQRTRPVDIAFAGNYSTQHYNRNRLLEKVAMLADRYNVVLALLHPSFRPLIDLPFIRRFTGPIPYLPSGLRKVCVAPVYGRDLYDLLSRAKIALNAGADLSGNFRGNMRCFEAMGCGACMLSDKGIYPPGLEPGTHFEVFSSPEDAVEKVHSLLSEKREWERIGTAGFDNLQKRYPKQNQWSDFQKLVAELF